MSHRFSFNTRRITSISQFHTFAKPHHRINAVHITPTAGYSTLRLAKMDANIRHRSYQKELRNQDDTLNKTRGHRETQSIRNKMDKARSQNNPHQIMQHLQSYHLHSDSDRNHFDSSIYGKAIKLLGSLHDIRSVQKAMDMLIKRISILDDQEKGESDDLNVAFSTFFNVMARSDRPFIAAKYYQILHKLGIIPNLITFSVLIKSCRSQGLWQQMEEYVHSMKYCYNITPNVIIVTEMIAVYSNGYQPEKAILVFDDYIQSMTASQLRSKEMMPLFGAYLNTFSRIGDIDKMQSVIDLMKENGHSLNAVIYSDLMRGCIVARKPYAAYKWYKRMQRRDTLNSSLTESVLDLKGIAMSMMISDDDTLSFDRKYKIFRKLVQHNTDRNAYKGKVSVSAALIELRAAIALYDGVNQKEIIRIFEEMVSDGRISYMKGNQIDFHCFDCLTVKFLLRYIVHHRLSDFVCDLKRNGGIEIIVGKGLHNRGGREYWDSVSIKECVVEELSTFDPPIKCRIKESNAGVVVIATEELVPHINALH